MTLHLETITEEQHQAITALSPLPELKEMYLAGGTALALQLGHRKSVDLDWFTEQRIDDPMQLAQSLRDAGIDFVTDSIDPSTLHGRVFGVPISFVKYSYPKLQPANSANELLCPMASYEDIAAMKLLAVAQRGAKKDFIDIHALVGARMSLNEMLDCYRKKYRIDDTSRLLYSLAYFDDAEAEPIPEMLSNVAWDDVKKDVRAWLVELESLANSPTTDSASGQEYKSQ